MVIVYTCISESKDAAVYWFKPDFCIHLVLIPGIKCRSSTINPGPTTIVRECPYWSCSKYFRVPGKCDRCRCATVFKFVTEKTEFRFVPDFDSSSIAPKEFTLINLND